MSFDWVYDGVDMSIRAYFASAIAKQEPGVRFDDSVTAFRSKDDSFVYKRHVWSPTRVYFICQDGRQQVQSRPRNPGMSRTQLSVFNNVP